MLNSGTPCGRRVEVLLLHQAGSEPSGTLDWLKPRPLLARHHHVRLSHNKVQSLHPVHAPLSRPTEAFLQSSQSLHLSLAAVIVSLWKQCTLTLCHLPEYSGKSLGMHVADAPVSKHVDVLKDMARVARWMAGKAVGLVLSGGGSRGLAHLGVLHALDDAGVPIDVIGGTSQVPQRPALKRPVRRPTSHSAS